MKTNYMQNMSKIITPVSKSKKVKPAINVYLKDYSELCNKRLPRGSVYWKLVRLEIKALWKS
jgi:hypothetical protein